MAAWFIISVHDICEMNYVILIILGEIMELARISISDDSLPTMHVRNNTSIIKPLGSSGK